MNPFVFYSSFILFFVYLFVLRSLSTWLVLTPSLIQNLFVFTLQLQNIFCRSHALFQAKRHEIFFYAFISGLFLVVKVERELERPNESCSTSKKADF